MRLVVPALLLAAAVPASTFAQSLSASRADSRAWVRAEFARADGNRDGVLSRGEVTRAVNRHYGRLSTSRSRILTNMWFNRLDGNRSNSISPQEAQEATAEFWGRLGPREREGARAFLQNPAR